MGEGGSLVDVVTGGIIFLTVFNFSSRASGLPLVECSFSFLFENNLSCSSTPFSQFQKCLFTGSNID